MKPVTPLFTVQDGQSGQIPEKKPWDRQEGESARWFMRFRNYLSLGSKRSINGTYELERKEKQLKASTKAGPEWYNAAKRYQWQVRADAWDKEQDEQKAQLMQAIATKCAFVSRPFRITQLNSAAETLMRELEKGHDVATFLALTKQLQALMHDIQAEVQAWRITLDASCDAAALDALKEKGKRMEALQQERDALFAQDMDTLLARLIQRDPTILPPGTNVDEVLAHLEDTGARASIAQMIGLRAGL